MVAEHSHISLHRTGEKVLARRFFSRIFRFVASQRNWKYCDFSDSKWEFVKIYKLRKRKSISENRANSIFGCCAKKRWKKKQNSFNEQFWLVFDTNKFINTHTYTHTLRHTREILSIHFRHTIIASHELPCSRTSTQIIITHTYYARAFVGQNTPTCTHTRGRSTHCNHLFYCVDITLRA